MKHWNEECAVVGVYGVENAGWLAYYALFAMQHRGQEASGMSVFDGETILTHKSQGLVSEVFDENILGNLKGQIAIGHNRYATAGRQSSSDAQPLYARCALGEVAVVHNGNLTNAARLREELTKEGSIFQSFLDTEVILHLIAKSKKESFEECIKYSAEQIKGAYCLIFVLSNKMIVLRDRYGLRPLSLGKIQGEKGEGYIVASETCAFDLLGAEYVRDIQAGEMIVFENGKMTSTQLFAPKDFKCIFEYVYFARPDSQVFGKNVYSIRKAMGRELARECKIDADIVVPVPDSGVPSALGYALESGIAFELGIIRNHYVGRTFIESEQSIRELKVKLKLNPIREIIEGKRVIVLDDSIVRGTTSRQIVKILKNAGAKEVHLLISSPPTISPCFYGVDTPSKQELICATHSLEEVRKYIQSDSLHFLSLEGLARSLGGGNYCQACFDGKYIQNCFGDNEGFE
ncbi:amidophosphoribosyltransferase [Helicobacter cholecystus]|uniref:Amidophosphoribosyltransferase n=1 Tax=Helicobacter cholecystus TaxID=45498 RepID=A0A3D8IUW8_9HELI|nr:amidophosphoribosyltransferase [Helicobacter cholecystus]RDU69077.1 amidophosphoribosyltransferase [Helicobacter cholecystus]VEJ24609.1 amidophosphoribosyltransferase [Helicobacter cholecystus]